MRTVDTKTEVSSCGSMKELLSVARVSLEEEDLCHLQMDSFMIHLHYKLKIHRKKYVMNFLVRRVRIFDSNFFLFFLNSK